MCGTLDYLPPEMVTGKNQSYDKSIDIWCLGVLTVEFVIGKPPFETGNDAATKSRIRRNDYTHPDGAPADYKDFVDMCLKPESSQRASLEQLEMHPWIRKNVDWDKMRELLSD